MEKAARVLQGKLAGGSAFLAPDAAACYSQNLASLLYPANPDMLHAFVLAFHHAVEACRARVAACLTREAYPATALTENDCKFVLRKLCYWAPHLLGKVHPEHLHVPLRVIAPACSNCYYCGKILKDSTTSLVPYITQLNTSQTVVLSTMHCRVCHASYYGPWHCRHSGQKCWSVILWILLARLLVSAPLRMRCSP